MPDKDPLEPPKEDIWDYLHRATKAALSVVPSAKEFYELVIAPPFQKRSIEWMETVAEKCREYETKFEEFKPDKLVDNEVFQSAFATSARIAVQNHQKKKLDALRNGLLNTVIMKDLEENFKLLFFNYIESMTVIHMDVLKFFRTLKEGKGALDVPYTEYFELYKAEHNLTDEMDYLLFTSICKDLENKGLLFHGTKIGSESRGPLKNPPGYFSFIRHSDLGKKFYQFILEPELKD